MAVGANDGLDRLYDYVASSDQPLALSIAGEVVTDTLVNFVMGWGGKELGRDGLT